MKNSTWCIDLYNFVNKFLVLCSEEVTYTASIYQNKYSCKYMQSDKYQEMFTLLTLTILHQLAIRMLGRVFL